MISRTNTPLHMTAENPACGNQIRVALYKVVQPIRGGHDGGYLMQWSGRMYTSVVIQPHCIQQLLPHGKHEALL